jgi:lipopolysaccharide/colanic/teichoic acid biosynthesis glycosyltransferase
VADMAPLADSSGQPAVARSAGGVPPLVSGHGALALRRVTADEYTFPSQRKSPSGSTNRRIRVVVLDDPQGTQRCTDRLDEEFNVVARLRSDEDLAHLHVVLALTRPKLLLIKSVLDSVDDRVMELCRAHRTDALVLARPLYGALGPVRLRRFGGLPWLRLSRRRKPGGGFAKRALDVLLVLAGAPLLLPMMILIAVLVCRDGPPLYWQKRVGKEGRTFRLIKFRTMYVDAEQATGPVLSSEGDPRVTSVGRILRRYRLDELPQLWNVLRGDMSLVGPRPERPSFVTEFRQQPHMAHYDLRHLIRPGLTGIRQLTGGYTSSPEESLRCDLLYANIRTLRLDLKLIGLTFLNMLGGFPRG